MRGLDQRGFVRSTPIALLSAGAVVVAGVAYFLTAPSEPPDAAQLTTAPRDVEPQVTLQRVRTVPVVSREQVYVVVFNNSGVTGLAGRTAERLTDAGWNVVGSDNWYGTIPASTVYFPEQLESAARMLADDLRIQRLRPAVDPMQMDRLTVILTPGFR